MKKLEPKKIEVTEPVKVEEPTPEPTPVKVVKTEKEKPDYTWVWVLIGLLATIAAFYFMNRNNDKDGNTEVK